MAGVLCPIADRSGPPPPPPVFRDPSLHGGTKGRPVESNRWTLPLHRWLPGWIDPHATPRPPTPSAASPGPRRVGMGPCLDCRGRGAGNGLREHDRLTLSADNSPRFANPPRSHAPSGPSPRRAGTGPCAGCGGRGAGCVGWACCERRPVCTWGHHTTSVAHAKVLGLVLAPPQPTERAPSLPDPASRTLDNGYPRECECPLPGGTVTH
jgi:hypothetical protein